MCKFKSGIILKTRCVVAEGSNDSHSDLLEELGIEDTEVNAMTKFVRAELIPPVDENETRERWWTDPDMWTINVDQDILPEWYQEDPEKYNEEFRFAVKDWWSKHVLIGQTIEELSKGFYLLKDCKVGKLQKHVKVILDDSTVEEMCNYSIVQEMYGNAVVRKMYGSSVAWIMYDNSIIQEMFHNSVVQMMFGKSVIQKMYDNSVVHKTCNNSTIQSMFDNSAVREMSNNSIVWKMRGNSTIQKMWYNSAVKVMHDNSVVREMYNNSTVQKIHGNSMARSYHSYQKDGKIQLFVSPEREFEMVVRENK